MPVSIEFLRGVIGLIGAGCAFMLGRTAAAVRRKWQKPARIYGWGLRTACCMIALAIRHTVDAAAMAVWAAAGALFALGFWLVSRPRKEEDLVSAIFPDKP